MDKKIGIVLVIAVVVVVALIAYGITQQANQTVVQNNTTVQQNSTHAKAIDVVATQKGPETAKKGMNVTIQYEVSNKGTEAVHNVQIDSQDFEQNLGTINPGETKKGSFTIYIPTDAEVQADFGANATVSNPFYIGGFSVKFNDAKGSKHSIMANSIEIKLT